MTKLIAIPLGYLLNGLYGIIGNYGISIIILTLIIRLAILPLYSKQIKSTQQMQEIQPLVNEIRTKYARDQQKMNEKMQELYTEHNIKPAAGCLPLLIQLPIIWGLFGLLRDPVAYINNPAMVLGAHESFLWVKDLAQPDLWILPIIAGLATFISTKMTSAGNDNSANPANASMKAMTYFMPVMIVWMGRTLPAGLTLYWAISYIFQIGQTKFMQIQKKKAKEESKKDAKKSKKK